MRYVILVEHQDQAPAMYMAPVDADDADYLRKAAAAMRPLSKEDYVAGPAALLHILVRYSYVLDGHDVYWCVEWTPGMIVIRFSPDGSMAWIGLQSPVPDFGGRKASKEEWDAYDEATANHQVNLIFEPWTAQFDEDERQSKGYVAANLQVEAAFEAALAGVNILGEEIDRQYGEQLEDWAYRGEARVAEMVGAGVRLE